MTPTSIRSLSSRLWRAFIWCGKSPLWIVAAWVIGGGIVGFLANLGPGDGWWLIPASGLSLILVITIYTNLRPGILRYFPKRLLISLNPLARERAYGFFFEYGYAAVELWDTEGRRDLGRTVRFVRRFVSDQSHRQHIDRLREKCGYSVVDDLGPRPRAKPEVILYMLAPNDLRSTREEAERDLAAMVLTPRNAR